MLVTTNGAIAKDARPTARCSASCRLRIARGCTMSIIIHVAAATAWKWVYALAVLGVERYDGQNATRASRKKPMKYGVLLVKITGPGATRVRVDAEIVIVMDRA